MSSSSSEIKKTKKKSEKDNEKDNENKKINHQKVVVVNLHVNGRKRTSKAIETICENSSISKEKELLNNGTNSKKRSNVGFQMEPNAVARRNERERNRVRLVNDGFSSLRQHIPYFPDKKKLSKVETLRCAVSYIKHLQKLIEEHDEQLALYSEDESAPNETSNYSKWVTTSL